jgi:hypothetical protein
MGAWGIGHFDNDDALDYVALLIKSGGISLLIRSLETVIQGDVVATYECTEALAAAEVVAALHGSPGELPEEAIEWVSKTDKPKDEHLKKLAIQAVQKIATSSELKDLWAESDDDESWGEEIQGLLKRLA